MHIRSPPPPPIPGTQNSGSNHLVNAVTKRSQDARSRTAQLREERSIAAAGPPGPKPLAEVKKAAGLQATGATGGQVAGAVKSGVGRRYISAVVTEVEKRGGQVSAWRLRGLCRGERGKN